MTSAHAAASADPASRDWSASPLDATALIATAEETAGMSDWGDDPSFRTGLGRLLAAAEAMDAAPRLRPFMAPHVIRLLTTRLRLADDARRHPQVLALRIERPLIVTGLPRTGSTWLYELLALDPAVRAPLDWEVQRPWPAPEAATFETDPRIAEMEAMNRAIVAGAPELATMHNFHARLPQECNAITAYHFASSNFWAVYAVPEYLEWLTHGGPEGVLGAHKRFLQQLQWKGPQGRWTLKSPPHILMLEELLATYPDACLIQTHREPARVVASLADMVRSRRRGNFEGERELMEPKAIARQVLGYFGEGLERAAENRRDPRIDGRFVDVAYRDLVRDPLPTLRRIYEVFDLPFTRVFEDSVKAHLGAPRETGHGQHRYDAAEFGVDALDLPNQFKAYRARFGDLLPDHPAH